MCEAPRVSVIMTAYNEADRISGALESVLRQALEVCEIVVVDDGSTDSTVNVVRGVGDARVRLVEAGRLGRGGALKLAGEQARGRYIANLDADDEVLPGRLVAQAAYLDAHPEVAWLGGAEEMVDTRRGERFVRRYPLEDTAIRKQAAKCIPYSHSAVMFRRSLLAEGLNYDPEQPYLIDFEFFLRVAESHKVANLPQTVVRRHVRGESYFQSRFSTARQNVRLSRWNALAIGRFNLPEWYYIYPLARLVYPYLPNWIKQAVRHRQGLGEVRV